MPVLHKTSFDEGFQAYEGQQHLRGPVGWQVIWVPGDKPGPVRPEIQPEIRSRGDRGIHSGENGVKLCHAFSFFDACLYKHFGASPGRIYSARVWTTAESGGGLACQIGIDPMGNSDPQSDTVKWSIWHGTDDADFESYHWKAVQTQAEAHSPQITVFLRCTCRDAVQVNAGFFDDFELSVNDGNPTKGGLLDLSANIQHALTALVDYVDTF